MEAIDADALRSSWGLGYSCDHCQQDARRCQYEYCYTLMDICEMLDDAPTVEIPGWIDNKDKTPEKDGQYLCITKINGQLHYQICLWAEQRWFWIQDVVYWMPLPEFPDGVDKETEESCRK